MSVVVSEIDRAASHRERALDFFRERFGDSPEFGARAPGRVNLIGDHTDYAGGLVLPMAIGLDVVCVGRVTTDTGGAGRLRLAAADLGEAVIIELTRDRQATWAPAVAFGGHSTAVSDSGALKQGSWAALMTGVVMNLARLPRWPRDVGLDLAVAANLPRGVGLASSAALEVAVARALNDALSLNVKSDELAAVCQRAEHEFGGVACGIMDQATSINGKAGHALLMDCASGAIKPIRVPPPDARRPMRPRVGRRRADEVEPDHGAVFLVVDSRIGRGLAQSEYNRLPELAKSAAKKMGVPHLAAADAAMLQQRGILLTDAELALVRHILGENERVRRGAVMLEAGDLRGFGKLMQESHRSLRDEIKVSTSALDLLVSTACAIHGVYGARLTGAGFGGCILILAHPDAVERVCRHLTKRYRDVTGRRTEARVVEPSNGASSLRLEV